MSLLEDAMDVCVMLNKQMVDDGYGGYRITWTEGVQFKAAIDYNTSIEARIGEVQGATSRYTVLFPKILPMEYHDVFRRIRDGKTFRATSDGDDYKAPNSAGPQINGLAVITAEEWTLTS